MQRSSRFLSLVAGMLLAGCVSAPRVVPISVVPGTLKPSADRIDDYPDALAVIVSVFVDDMKFPRVEASLILYPNADTFKSGLVTELGYEQTLAAQTASFAWGVGGHKKVLANESHLSRQGWPERIRFLAHELTHTIQYGLANGRRSTSDQWFREGFADWVSYRVLEALGLDTYARRRQTRIDQAWGARQRQTFPSLTEMVSFRDWTTLRITLGGEATYAQAFLAVDLLIERRGLPAVIKYFELFGRSNDRLANFEAAFGEGIAEYEREFSGYFDRLLGR